MRNTSDHALFHPMQQCLVTFLFYWILSLYSIGKIEGKIHFGEAVQSSNLQFVSEHPVSYLCYAQCMARCEDIKATEEDRAIEPNKTEPSWQCFNHCSIFVSKDWMSACNNSHCVETCSFIHNGTETSKEPPSTPRSIYINQTETYEIVLTWTPAESRTDHAVFYVVEERPWLEDTSLISNWTVVNHTMESQMRLSIGVCTKKFFHVAAVNQFGTEGFSTDVLRYDFPAPSVVDYQGEEIFYDGYFFTYQLFFRPPEGWNPIDIGRYYHSEFYSKICDYNPLPPVPLTPEIRKVDAMSELRVFRMRLFWPADGCSYFSELYADSLCFIQGEPLSFVANLSDCEKIVGKTCPTPPHRPPGPVRDIHSEVADGNLNVTLSWLQPIDLGSRGYVEFYVIQWSHYSAYLTPGEDELQPEEESRKTLQVDHTRITPETIITTCIKVGREDQNYSLVILALDDESDDVDHKLRSARPQHFFIVNEPETITSTERHFVSVTPGTSLQPAETTIDPQDHERGFIGSENRLVVVFVIPVGLVLLIGMGILSAVLYKKRRNKLKRFTEGSQLKSSFVLQRSPPQHMVDNPFYLRQTNALEIGNQWEISRDNLLLGEILGKGAFGQVIKGELICQGAERNRDSQSSASSSISALGNIDVAVKTLLEFADATHRADFIKEIEMMKTIGPHPNVVSIIGCITQSDPLCLIVEHLPNGDLLHYLRGHRLLMVKADNKEQVTIDDLYSFARQIAVGMEFLSQNGFVHRDLATRNVLVGENSCVKIGDFGLTRYVYDDKVYVTKKGGKLPLKWMAIESIFDLTFTSASDVWSFGVVLFELVTLGGTPYPTINNKDLLKELKSGYRMDRPDNCTDQLYQMMMDCWSELPADRPTFTILRNWLEAMIEDNCSADYLSLSLDYKKDYYSVELSGSSGEDDEVFSQGSTETNGSELEGRQEMAENGQGSSISMDIENRRQFLIGKEGWHPKKMHRINIIPKRPSKLELSIEPDTVEPNILPPGTRRSAQDHLRVSTCSTDQLLPNWDEGCNNKSIEDRISGTNF